MTTWGRFTTITLDSFLGASLVAISLILANVAFWRMGSGVRDIVSVTDYSTVVAAGQEKSFGYGGEMREQQAAVEFQGREMSDMCFLVRRDASQRLYIIGRDD